MQNNGKEFVVSVADFAFYVNDVLACTGTTNLSSTVSVSMEEQAVNAGKGNQKIFSFKYGREMTVELEAANWRLEYIAMQTGSQIANGSDFYHLNECVTLSGGSGTIADTPIGKVGVELPNGTFIETVAVGKTINLSTYGLTTEKVYVTYQYAISTKRITIDAETSPLVGKLVLQADKHNSKKGKVGTVEIVVPSYSLDGNFDISFTPDGVTSTTMSGTALAVEGDSCEDGSAVYAYISEITDDGAATQLLTDIALLGNAHSVAVNGTIALSTIGIVSAMYKPVELDVDDLTYSATYGTISDGIYTAPSTVPDSDSDTITVSYTTEDERTLTDTLVVTVVTAG